MRIPDRIAIAAALMLFGRTTDRATAISLATRRISSSILGTNGIWSDAEVAFIAITWW